MQRVCFCKTVSLFNHILQPSQALAIFYQSLIFSLKNLELIKWISFNIDIPIGLQLLMIDINGNVTIDNDLLYKHLSNIKRDVEQRTDTSVILKWISRIVLRLTTDHSLSSKFERSYEFENFYNFLKQFHTNSTDDHSSLLNNDKRIINDDQDEEDISRRAIHCALIKCIDYAMTNSSNTLDSKPNNIEMQDFESNSIALYNQQILQILCSDTLELEIELAHDSHQSSFELLPQSSIHDHTLTSYYSTWAALWRDVTVEYLQFNSNKCLKKVMIDNFKHDNHSWSIRENDRILNEITEQQRNLKKPIIKSYKINENNFCLHDRLMFEIKQNKQLKPSKKSLTIDSNRKRIHPIQKLIESDSSSDDDEHRDEYGRKRVIVVDCLLESSPEDNTTNKLTVKKLLSEHNLSINTLTNKKTSSEKINHSTIENLEIEYISMEQLIRLMKDSSDTLSLTYDEFCHIRNVITRSELETLLFDEKLYIEVAQGKLCFTCRKVYFNILTFTFGIQCSVCKQKICRNCVKQITLPKERLNDLPIQAITPLTLSKSLSKSDRLNSLDIQSPQTPTMNDIISDLKYDDTGSRRCSTPGGMSSNQIGSSPWRTEPIDICTDCFFLLQQIRKKSRQHHVSPAVTSNLVSSTSSSSSFNRMQHSTSNYNLSSSSSASSIAALLAAQHQQRSLMVKTISVHSNLKQAKSSQELSANNDSLQTLTTTNDKIEKVSLSRRNLFLQLQPAYDVKLNNNNIKTG